MSLSIFRTTSHKRGKMPNVSGDYRLVNKPMTVKELEKYLVSHLFKTKKKSLTNQRVSKK